MRPWQISIGVTVALMGLGVFWIGVRFDYLQPYTRLLFADYWPYLAVHGAVAVACFMVPLATALRSFGLQDVGRKVDLVERSMRRGEGDPELARRLNEEAEGSYSE